MKPAWRLYILTACFLAAFASAAFAAESAATPSPVTRVALLGAAPDPRLQSIRELAEVQLDQAGELQVLERQSVERLLAEQHLSLSGLVDAERAVKAGKVLSADLLAIVESSPKSQGAALVIFDPATGVRLWDSALATDDGEKSAAAIVSAVREAAGKRKKTADLHTVCLMTVRNADLPHDMDGFCDAIGPLLERHLVGSPKLALLERSRLEKVEQERALNADARHADLFPSLIVVELEISRADSTGALRATAFLSDGAGKSLGKLTALSKEHDAVALGARLADEFATHLQAPAGAKVDRAAEAMRFYTEALLRTDASDYRRAIVPAEAAHALAPENVLYRARLAHALILCGSQRKPDRGTFRQPRDAAQLLTTGAAMLPDIYPLSFEASGACGATIRTLLTDAANLLCGNVGWQAVDQSLLAPQKLFTPDEIAATRESLRRYLLEEDAHMAEDVKSPEAMYHYSFHFATLLDRNEWVFSGSSGQWAADHARLSAQWLDLYAKYPSEPVGTMVLDAIAIDSPLARKITMRNSPPAARRVRRWDLAAADYEPLEGLRKKLQSDANPRIRRYGDWCALSIEVTRNSRSSDTMKECVGDYIEKMKRELVQPRYNADLESRRQFYQLIAKADLLLDTTPWAGHFCPEVLDFALSRHEIEGAIIQQGIVNTLDFTNLPPKEVARRIEAIQRVHELLQSPDCIRLTAGYNDAHLQKMLERLKHPDDIRAGQATTQPSGQVTRLVDVFSSEESLRQVSGPIIEGNWVYAVGGVADKSAKFLTAQLLRIPIGGGPLEYLGSGLPTRQPAFRAPPRFRPESGTPMAAACCLAEGRYCAATRDDGLFIFRTDNGSAEHVSVKEGLPTGSARSVALLDGKVYAGLGSDGQDGYLISYQISSRRVDVVASNARKEKRSPFDDGTVFTIPGLVADPSRHRLIVVIQRVEPTTQVNGIWEYTPETDRWRPLLPMRLFLPDNSRLGSYRATQILAVGALRNDRLPVGTNMGVCVFDLKEDKVKAVFQHNSTLLAPPLPLDTPIDERTTPAGRAAGARCWPSAPYVFELTFPCIWTSGHISTTWARANLKTGQLEHFGSLREGGYPFVPVWFAPNADGSKLIVADNYGMWLLAVGNSEEHEGRLEK